MKVLRSIALPLLLVTIACGDDSTGLEASDLEGTWRASAIAFTDNADAQSVVDILQRDGASLTLTVTASGEADSLFDDGVGGSSSDSGDLSSSGTTLTLGGQVFAAVRQGDVLTLTDEDELFDFGSGNEVPATLRITLNRS